MGIPQAQSTLGDIVVSALFLGRPRIQTLGVLTLTSFLIAPVTIATRSITTRFVSNVAMKRPTMQSSEIGDGSGIAFYGVDGYKNPNQDYENGLCLSTKVDSPAWWIVDLLRQFDIIQVEIVNRDTNQDMLQNFTIDVFKHNPNPVPGFPNIAGQVCAHQAQDGTYPNDEKLYMCAEHVRGRYLRIIKHGSFSLHMCEVKVFTPAKFVDVFFKDRSKDKTANIPPMVSTRNVMKSYAHCAAICVETKRCNSFSWNEDHLECGLYIVSPYSPTLLSLVDNTGTDFTLNLDEL